MGAVLEFDAFVTEVREHLWVLEVEPAFQLNPSVARFMWPPYTAELEPLNATDVRVALSFAGQLVRTIQYVMDAPSARLAAEGIVALFEPEPQ
jgi:hypothetical protein